MLQVLVGGCETTLRDWCTCGPADQEVFENLVHAQTIQAQPMTTIHSPVTLLLRYSTTGSAPTRLASSKPVCPQRSRRLGLALPVSMRCCTCTGQGRNNTGQFNESLPHTSVMINKAGRKLHTIVSHTSHMLSSAAHVRVARCNVHCQAILMLVGIDL